MSESRRIAFFLPNIFTALNLACGFSSMIFAWRGQYYYAGMILILGAIFDSVDGRVARFTGTQSSFGEQFDSMSDVVSFGVAPSVLIYNRFLVEYGRLGIVISFAFLLCGAMRLARFNANIDRVSSTFFQGLPIPGAALAMVGFVFISLAYPIINHYSFIALGYTFFYALLMISNIPFPSFKNSQWAKKHKKQFLALIFLVLSSIFIYEELMVGVFISIYTIGSIIYFLTHKGQLSGVFEWKDESEAEEVL
jgi:CDP-diacylglycerol--serine O-phosphatidyltransferase